VPRESEATLNKPMDPRYVASDETVTDKTTGLVWKRCIAGQSWDGNECRGNMRWFGAPEAEEYAAKEAETSQQPWRIPTKSELLSLVSKTRTCPATDIAAFGRQLDLVVAHKQSPTWVCCQSIESVRFNSGEATNVFADGVEVRLVRSGD
jgi:hypothetical protein